MKTRKGENCEGCEHNINIYNLNGDITFYLCLKGLSYGNMKNYPIIPNWCPLEDENKKGEVISSAF